MVKHFHRTLIGRSGASADCEQVASNMPTLTAATFTSAARSAWLEGAQAEPNHELLDISLQQLVHNVALDPSTAPIPATLRASSSSWGEGVTADQSLDQCIETETQWIRIHVLHHVTYLQPEDVLHGPKSNALGPLGVTHMVFSDGTWVTQNHDWREPKFPEVVKKQMRPNRQVHLHETCGWIRKLLSPIACPFLPALLLHFVRAWLDYGRTRQKLNASIA